MEKNTNNKIISNISFNVCVWFFSEELFFTAKTFFFFQCKCVSANVSLFLFRFLFPMPSFLWHRRYLRGVGCECWWDGGPRMQLEASSSGARSYRIYVPRTKTEANKGRHSRCSNWVLSWVKKGRTPFFFHLNEATQQETGAAKKLQGHPAEMLNRAQFMLHCAVAKKITPVKYVHGHIFPVLLVEQLQRIKNYCAVFGFLKNAFKLTDQFLKTTQRTGVDNSAVSGPNAIRQPSFLAACTDVPSVVESVQVDSVCIV